MSDIAVNLVGVLPLQRQLELLQMGPNRRRRLLYRVAQRVIKDSKQRVRRQVDLNGMPYKERWRQRTHHKRKMLAWLIRELAVVNNDSLQATIGFKRNSGRIAAKQQHGLTERGTAAKNREAVRAINRHFYDKPATKKQARALRKAGFKVKIGGKKARKAPIAWITEHMTIGQAGYALRRLREWSGERAKVSWLTVLPARSFLGATAAEITAHINDIYEQMTQELQRGAR